MKYDCGSCGHKKVNKDPNLHCYMFQTPVTPEGECMQHTARPKISQNLAKFGLAAAVIGIMTDTEIKFPPCV
jgi:hypothetical protein